MKFLVDEMPYYRSDCPFWLERDRNGDDYCKCGNKVYDCEYFMRSHDPYYCNWLKVIESDN